MRRRDGEMATKSKPLTFGVRCVHCADPDAELSINLGDLEQITCSACDTTYSAREARDLAAAELARWEKVCKWIQMAGEVLASDQP
jgi:hypothetical protein